MDVARSLGARLVLALLMISFSSIASADDDDDDDGDATSLTAGWNGDGAFIKSEDDAFFMEIGGRVHLDFRAYTADFAPPPTFLIRRARLEVQGKLYRVFEFKVQADFADDESLLLRDGFVNIHAKDVVQVIAGQFKAPFSQEEFQSSKYMTFVERSMINNIVPGRSPGVMVHGYTKDNVIRYGASVQNDEGELGLNRNGGPDFFGQGRFEPWRAGTLDTFSFGGAIGIGKRERERFVVGRTSSRSVVFFDEIPLNGTLVRRNVEGWWYPGPLLIQSEFDDLSAERSGLAEGGGNLPDVKARGFMVEVAYVLTGETNAPDDPIEPDHPVHAGGWGAWEVGARYQFFEAEGTERANRVDDVTVAVNWWFNKFIHYQANFSWEKFRHAPNPLTTETSNWTFVTRLNMYF
ncbi:MAG: OprO/OprP family phosphate-selective porin [Acidobacteriota bacterium]|nr:MAG: OprO/OprP family phosphate-selective porin [Acidobacteriota bacterium]